MNTRALKEIGVVALLVMLVIGMVVPSLQHARRERRDGQRREDVAGLKRELEMYFNQHETYPLTFTPPAPYQYVIMTADTSGALGWYVRAPLENKAEPRADFDYEEGHNFYYRVVREREQTFYDVCGGTFSCTGQLEREPGEMQ
ncbi:MAG: hypothetical protein WEA04_00490 [Candidatus Andersenbacteria bacterium]